MNLDAVRLYLALSVCGYHAAFLAGRPLPIWALRPDIAVSVFFVLSGALIFASLDRGQPIAEFYRRRFRRIYPGYATVVIMSGLFLATSVVDAVSYIAPNLLFLNFLQPSIAGVFDGGPINGALWTLKIEVGFYLIAPLLFVAMKRYGFRVLLGIALASVVFAKTVPAPWGHQLLGQMHWFALGAAIYRLWGLPKRRWSIDLSFGLYIVHFPISQLFAGQPSIGMAASFVAAMVLWLLIERPLRPHQATRTFAPALLSPRTVYRGPLPTPQSVIRQAEDTRRKLSVAYHGIGRTLTPLATLHAFNGWADKFLVTPPTGLRDLYVDGGYTVAADSGFLSGTGFRFAFHDFRSTENDLHYGREWDAMISRNLYGPVSLTLKFAYYDAIDFASDTTKGWLQLDARF